MTIFKKISLSVGILAVALIWIFAILKSGQAPKLDSVKTVTIKKGKHAASPHWWSWKKREVYSMKYTFDETVIYDLKNSNQQDWNKLGGLSWNLFTNKKNSAMVSWRLGLKCDCI